AGSGGRQFTRFTVSGLRATLTRERADKSVTTFGTVLDISLGGLLVACAKHDAALHPGAIVSVSIHLPRRSPTPLTCRVARVVASDGGARHVGLEFLEGTEAQAKCALL